MLTLYHSSVELESSSRLRNQNGAIYLSAPLIYRADDDQPITTPVGFVLTRERLITVRFHELSFFQTLTDRDLAAESDPLSSTAVFAGLIDAIADRLADILENIAAELDALSHRLFRSPATEPAARRPPARESADLRIILRRVGHSVPPTLVASMYGMNFKNMPELDWSWGYPYGLALIALSAILPVAWFKWRGWI